MSTGVWVRIGSAAVLGLTAAAMLTGVLAGVVLAFVGFAAFLFWVGLANVMDTELVVIIAMLLTLFAFIAVSGGALHFWEESD